MNTLNIREARKAAKLTQDQLAEKIGVNRATLSKYESGQIDPSFSQLMNIANALNIHVIELFNPAIAEALKSITDKNMDSADECIRKRFGIVGDYVVVETDNDDIRKLMQSYGRLNSEGQKVAIDRVAELSQVPKYQRTAPPESANDNDPISDTPEQKKPPEGEKTPNDGK